MSLLVVKHNSSLKLLWWSTLDEAAIRESQHPQKVGIVHIFQMTFISGLME
jgi:hypothetical protein